MTDATVWREIGDPLIEPLQGGPLAGESVAVKDLFAVAGFAVGAGVPQYWDEQPIQTEHASAVRRLLEAGASVRGIARTDQFAYSLDGDNPHYGTPPNPAVPGALPGGSSSGSATAVSLGEASIGLATDTAGSVRVPASYQGLWGLRTTHGSVPADGLLPLSPDFDTIGLLTRTPDLLLRATSALLDEQRLGLSSASLASMDRCRATNCRCSRSGKRHSGSTRRGRHGRCTARGSGRTPMPCSAACGAGLNSPPGSARTSTRQLGRPSSPMLVNNCMTRCWATTLLILPSAAGPAPRADADPAMLDANRRATLRLTCIADITGRPVVSAPLTTTPNGPVGTSYLGPQGSDLALIERAAADAA